MKLDTVRNAGIEVVGNRKYFHRMIGFFEIFPYLL